LLLLRLLFAGRESQGANGNEGQEDAARSRADRAWVVYDGDSSRDKALDGIAVHAGGPADL
jgi:hypothetical protein